MNKPRVLMIGPGRDVMGGISTVINNYYKCGLDKEVDLLYLPTMEDGNKAKKLYVAMKAYLDYSRMINRYDIIHVHMAAQASFDRKAVFIEKAYKAGKKIIIHQHAADFDSYFTEQVNEKKRQIIKDVFQLADKVVVLSEQWADFFGENVCDRNKIEILYNGVTLPNYEKTDYSDHNVIILGRLGKRKGTYDLLEAIPRVISAVPDAVFYFGGDGDVEVCTKIAVDKGLKDHVVFLGWIDDRLKKEYFKKCSTFILPSYHEGMPMAILEAMSYGLATISTNAGGIPQIIDQDKNGLRIEAGDVDAIAKILIDVLEHPLERERLGKAARIRIAGQFDAMANLDALISIYKELTRG